MSKQKQQGTKLETFVAKMLNGSRIAEGGINDKGDVLFNWNGPIYRMFILFLCF